MENCPKCDAKLKKRGNIFICTKCGMQIQEYDDSDVVALPKNHPLNESGKSVVLNEG